MGLQLREPPMPEMPAPDFFQSRMALAAYIEWVGYLLDMMREYRDWQEDDGIRYFEPELTGPFADAHEEFREQGHIERVAALFADPEDAEILAASMLLHGLTGRQLFAKMNATRFYTAGLRTAARKRARAILSRLLATVNSLLKSALAAVPGGAAIDEMKQVVENMRFVEDDLDE